MGGDAHRAARLSIPRRHIAVAEFPRPATGPVYTTEYDGLIPSGLPAFQSNGGVSRSYPDRRQPHSFEVKIPEIPGILRRISLLGVFALYVGKEPEKPGALGATIRGYVRGHETFRFDLFNGATYDDCRRLDRHRRSCGDGSSLEQLGAMELLGAEARVDLLSLDIPSGTKVESMRFTDMGTPASFVIFDVFFEFSLEAGCPFRAQSGGVSLNELAAVVRVGDRVRFNMALAQLDTSIEKAEDLDEARGQSLTFLAIVTASTLELGGPRSMVRVSLEAARQLDRLESREEIRTAIHLILREVAEPLFVRSDNPSTALIDRALAMLDRNYARDLSSDTMADFVGMSTSHFRHLFREATGQPFHRYLMNLRLEKAKSLLQDGDLPVSQVASLIGFAGLSHFSRAFSSRFRVSPTSLRRSQVFTS